MSRKSRAIKVPIICHSVEAPEEPNHDKERVTSVADALDWEEELRTKFFGEEKSAADDRLQEIWFRGTRKHFPLVPGIYREEITELAEDKRRDLSFGRQGGSGSALEWKRLNLEREMMLTFERESGPLLQYTFEQELYFLARHYGMPSRLLDWSISPLIALFMCVFPEPRRPSRGSTQEEQEEEDGVLYAMDPEELDPPGYICHQHDPKVEKAIEAVTMWKKPSKPAILPIRPHTLAGRIDRQLSRFTLHCHGAKPQKNETLRSRRVSLDCKERIGVNEFSVYCTLDRLASDINDRFSNLR